MHVLCIYLYNGSICCFYCCVMLAPHGIIGISHVLTFTHVVRKLTAATVHTAAAACVVVNFFVVVILLLTLAARACFMFLQQIASNQQMFA